MASEPRTRRSLGGFATRQSPGGVANAPATFPRVHTQSALGVNEVCYCLFGPFALHLLACPQIRTMHRMEHPTSIKEREEREKEGGVGEGTLSKKGKSRTIFLNSQTLDPPVHPTCCTARNVPPKTHLPWTRPVHTREMDREQRLRWDNCPMLSLRGSYSPLPWLAG
jgi:hypothetical protein